MKKLKNTFKNIFMFVMRQNNIYAKSSQTVSIQGNGKPTGASPYCLLATTFCRRDFPIFQKIKMRQNENSNTNGNNSTNDVGAALPNKAQSNSVYKQKYEQTKLLTELFMVYIEDYATHFIFSEEKAKELTSLYYQAQTGVDIS